MTTSPYKTYPLDISKITTPRYYAFRSYPQLVPNLPYSVLSIGHVTYPQGYYCTPAKASSAAIYWGIKGKNRFWTGKEWFYLQPEYIYVLYPNEEIYFEIVSNTCTYGLIEFDNPRITTLLAAFGLTDKSYRVGPCLEQDILEIGALLGQRTEECERTASSLAYNFLIKMTATIYGKRIGPLIQQCRNEIHRCLTDPDFNIDTLVDNLKIQRTTLFRRFKATYGISPGRYLHQQRIQYALDLLSNTYQPIQEIASRSGFATHAYFSNVIRKTTGLSPEKYRKKYPAQNPPIHHWTHPISKT